MRVTESHLQAGQGGDAARARLVARVPVAQLPSKGLAPGEQCARRRDRRHVEGATGHLGIGAESLSFQPLHLLSQNRVRGPPPCSGF